MGNAGSSRAIVSRKDRKEREAIRTNRVQQNVNKVNHYTAQYMQHQSSSAPQHSAIVNTTDSLQHFKILSTAHDQLQRGDRPLTKADLTAILLRLQPRLMNPNAATAVYENLTSRDLIVLIREIIYDPSTAFPSSSSVSPTSSSPNQIVLRTS
jgi:hypothetical protein